jgi:hypothetical protein
MKMLSGGEEEVKWKDSSWYKIWFVKGIRLIARGTSCFLADNKILLQ